MAEAVKQAVPEITREEIRARLGASSFALIDVLPAESYRAGHIPGAASLPIAQIGERATTLLPDRTQEIAVYCGGFT